MKINGNVDFGPFSLLILIIGGVLFYIFPNWFLIPTFGLLWFFYSFKLDRNINILKLAFTTGAFISLFDFVLENVGAQLGYWVSKHSFFFVMSVPIEIITGSFIAGTAWYLLYFSRKVNLKIALASFAIWSIGGTAGEYYLKFEGLMAYGNGWQSLPHAFLTYFISFCIFYLFALFLSKKFKKVN